MILLLAIVAGLLAGFIRAWSGGRSITIPKVRWLWLVPLAFLPQFFAFQLPATRMIFPDHWIPIALVGSQLLLGLFVVVNVKLPGFWLLGTGLLLNLLVISLNGGWMPISPETITRLAPYAPPGAWKIGSRLTVTKDLVLPQTETRLWFLSDVFITPSWFPTQVAFSIGDILIALGAVWFLWSLGGSHELA